MTYEGESVEAAFISAAAGESLSPKTEGSNEIRIFLYLDNGDLQVILLAINPEDMTSGVTLPTDGSSVEAYFLQVLPGSDGEKNETIFLGFLTGGSITIDQAGQEDGDAIEISFSFEIYAPPEEW
jgi:hypothetical protein